MSPSGSRAPAASAMRCSMSSTAVTGSSASSKRMKRSARSASVPAGSQTSTARWTTWESVIGSGSVGIPLPYPSARPAIARFLTPPGSAGGPDALHPLDRRLDLLERRARVDGAEPQHGAAAQHGRRRRGVALAHHRLGDPRLVAALAGEADDPELSRRDDLPPRPLAQDRLGMLGEPDPLLHRVPERRHAEHLHGQPQLQRAGATAQLHAAVAEVDLAAEGVAEIFARERERPLERAGLAQQHRAG